MTLRADPRLARRADDYAAKLYADGVTFLSYANITAALSHCVRPPKPGEVDAIRAAYIATYGADGPTLFDLDAAS